MTCLSCVAPRVGRPSAQPSASQPSAAGKETTNPLGQAQSTAKAVEGSASQPQKPDAAKMSAGANADAEKQQRKSNSPLNGTVSESLTDTVVEGGLSKKTVGRILLSNREKILTCYNKELANNPESQGIVLTKIDINNSGKVTAVSVLQSDLGDYSFETCLISAIKRYKFPTPRGGKEVRVSHPFRFSPE